MENSNKVTEFCAKYAADFDQQQFVEEVIAKWESGTRHFTLKTSGSTGTPKDIQLSRELLIWSVESTKKALQLPSDINVPILCCLPVTKTGGFMQLIRALHFGWTIYFTKPSNSPLDEWDVHQPIKLTSFTPIQLSHILNKNAHSLIPFRDVLIGGAAISTDLENSILHEAKHTPTQFWETYGMTETASHIALRKIGRDKYFIPQPGVQLSLEDEQLCISIPEIHFYVKTNDIAKLTHDGFELLGRVDDVINSGGVKIHPHILEPLIKSILLEAGISRNFYLGKKLDQVYGETAVLVMEGIPIKNAPHLLEIIKRAMPKYQEPKEIHFVPHIEFTDTGKIIRQRITS